MKKFDTKHTSGPWEIGDENNASFEVMIGDATCSIDRAHRHTGEYIISREEMIANGHLIFAAPLLLSALVKALPLLEHICDIDVSAEIKEAITAIAAAGVNITDVPDIHVGDI